MFCGENTKPFKRIVELPFFEWRTQLQPVVDSEEDLVLAAVPVVAAEDADGAVVVDAVAVVAARKTPRSGFQ